MSPPDALQRVFLAIGIGCVGGALALIVFGAAVFMGWL